MSNPPAATSEPQTKSPYTPGGLPLVAPTRVETNWVRAGFGLGIGFSLAALVVAVVPIAIILLVIGLMIGAASHTTIP